MGEPQDDQVKTSTPEQETSAMADPSGLEAELRLMLPKHTHFQTGPGFVAHNGCGHLDNPVRVCQATWSTTEGVWTVAAWPHHDNDQFFGVKVDGPDTELSRQNKTKPEAIALLIALGVLPGLSVVA